MKKRIAYFGIPCPLNYTVGQPKTLAVALVFASLTVSHGVGDPGSQLAAGDKVSCCWSQW